MHYGHAIAAPLPCRRPAARRPAGLDGVRFASGSAACVFRRRARAPRRGPGRRPRPAAAPAKVASAKRAGVDRGAVWDRMDAHGLSQNEVARRAGVSTGHLSQIMSGKANPSPGVLKKLHGVLFHRSNQEERVMPAEVKVLGWRKGERSGMVVRGAGGPGSKVGGGTIRVGGRVPWGAKVEYAFRTGYDGRGRVSTTHVVERGYSAMLKQPELGAA